MTVSQLTQSAFTCVAFLCPVVIFTYPWTRLMSRSKKQKRMNFKRGLIKHTNL